jgi:hypothetical protein
MSPKPPKTNRSIRDVIRTSTDVAQIEKLVTKSKTFDAPARTKRRIREAAEARISQLTAAK